MQMHVRMAVKQLVLANLLNIRMSTSTRVELLRFLCTGNQVMDFWLTSTMPNKETTIVFLSITVAASNGECTRWSEYRRIIAIIVE